MGKKFLQILAAIAIISGPSSTKVQAECDCAAYEFCMMDADNPIARNKCSTDTGCIIDDCLNLNPKNKD